jgi:DNA modification methylase
VILLGDCLEKLKELPNNSVDMVLTSPPYDYLRIYNNQPSFTFENFKVVADELTRIIKTGSVIVWVVGDQTIKGSETGTSFRQALYFKDECGLNLHDTMIYQKRGGPPLTHKRYEQKFEYMFVLSKGAPKTFNPILDPCIYAGQSRGGTYRHTGNKLSRANKIAPVKEKKIRGNVWDYKVGKYHSTKHIEAHKHPAIFPDVLAVDHIISWSNENEIVLDPFLGSGTTAAIAKKLNRKFIGIEREKEYFEIAKKRIEAVP